MKRLFRLAYLNLLIFACLFVIFALSVLFFYKTRQLIAMNQWVTHTQETMITGYNILNDEQLKHLMTQKFIITGEEKYLASYQKSIQSVHNDVLTLKNLTRDNPLQQSRLEKLQKSMQQETNAINSLIDTRKIHSQYLPNETTSENISNVVHDVLNEEKDLLKIRSSSSFSQLVVLNKIGLIADISSLFVVLICLMLLNRQLITHFITERKLEKSEIKFKKLAYLDPITGLNNRISLIDQLNNIIKNAELTSNTLTLFYIDIDNFKNINDSFGHAIGDKALHSSAMKIKHVFNQEAHIFRISGDEFVVILEGEIEQSKISALANELLLSFSMPIELVNQKIIATISIGICFFPQLANDADSLIRNADIAMYKAKQLGKNNYQFCNQDMIKEFEGHARIYHQLQNAVMNKEFILMYQPKLSLKTNELSGLEALIRWKKTNMGLIYPSEFISIAENNGLIIPIGEWVMRNVCIQAKKWQQSGIKISNIAFNVSIREFVMRDFSSTITKLFDELDFDPRNLEIEITETILMEDYYNNFSSLEYLKSLGVKITIDDFGTGYSSLSYLNLFPVDKLKIDKSFIAQIKQQNPEPVIISAIISMAHKLGIQVVAEGVETQMQLDFLKHHQCDEIQGYHFSKPLSAEEVHVFVTNHHSI